MYCLMPRRVHHIGGVVAAVGVQVLCPGIIRVAGIAVLAEEPACGRLVEPRVHILQAGGLVVYAAGKGHFVQKLGGARLALYVSKLVVFIPRNLAAVRLILVVLPRTSIWCDIAPILSIYLF